MDHSLFQPFLRLVVFSTQASALFHFCYRTPGCNCFLTAILPILSTNVHAWPYAML